MTLSLNFLVNSSDKHGHTLLHNIKMFKLSHFCLIVYIAVVQGGPYIENFSAASDISSWIEHSDTVQDLGKSKAALALFRTSKSQNAVLFTLLNPQPCGAAFAGVRKYVTLDLTPYTNVVLRVRGRGAYNGYKLILKPDGHSFSFCNFFKVSGDFQDVALPLKEFKPYREGKLVNDPNVGLDLSKITSIGIQAYGGAYLPVKQSGVASLEIEWIKYE